MTTRVYLVAARLGEGPPEANDLPAERIFIHASEPAELWVETESNAVPEAGKAVCFALVKRMDLGFERVRGTVERKVTKGAATGA